MNETRFLNMPPDVPAAGKAPPQAPNNAKSLNVHVGDMSDSMNDFGKWPAFMDAQTSIFEGNRDNGAYFMRVYFEVNRARDSDFLPAQTILSKQKDPTIRPNGRTAFYDAGCRAIRYLLDGLNRYPKDKRPYGSVTFFTDGLDNESKSGSKDTLRILIRGLLAEFCPNQDYDNARLMVIYWAFGDGTPADEARHREIAADLGIPECWVRYSKGTREGFERAGHSVSQVIDSMTSDGGTRMF